MPLVSTMCFQNCLTALWRSTQIIHSPAFTAICLMNLHLCASPASLFPSPGRYVDTHTIIEGSLPARRLSKTVGRRAKQYTAGSATKTSRPLTNSSIAFCCWCFKLSKPNACTAASIAASICSLLSVSGYVYLVWLARLPPERFCTL